MPRKKQKRAPQPLIAGYALNPQDFIELVQSFPRFAVRGPDYLWNPSRALAAWSCLRDLPHLMREFRVFPQVAHQMMLYLAIIGETDIARAQENDTDVAFTMLYCRRSFPPSSLEEYGAEQDSDRRALQKFASLVQREGGKFDQPKMRWIPNVGHMTPAKPWGY
ncbi:hypothetical protein DL96DRAFT_1617186 [Flagelloscypha sp. PMI_526]|nr:hypothetical protein DL96DRAFT_1617186 [Flagelloscypha sp. PMI_526]